MSGDRKERNEERRRRGRNHVALGAAAMLGMAVAILAGSAAASTAAFSFVMELRAVLGDKNQKKYTLDAGELTFSGAIWVVSKSRGASSAPLSVTIRVKKPSLLGSEVCAVSVTPNTIFHAKRSFEKSCGRVESGTYWIDVRKPDTDGWHIQGSGTLVTK